MGIVAAEDLLAPAYRFRDPDAFLTCDDPGCDAPWVTGDGLVSWRLAGPSPQASIFTERILAGCNDACLIAAQQDGRWRHFHWSEPMPVRQWLDALWSSLDLDPDATRIGSFQAQYTGTSTSQT